MSGEVVTIDDGGSEVTRRYPRALGRQPLHTVGDVRDEMARVYRAVTQGKVSSKQGAQLVYMLQTIARTRETNGGDGELEQLLDEVRRRLIVQGRRP